jgi:2-polyprenyl-3-methyl-5-hydroxy-6-metoxy-1,4-benzoquinol methylase
MNSLIPKINLIVRKLTGAAQLEERMNVRLTEIQENITDLSQKIETLVGKVEHEDLVNEVKGLEKKIDVAFSQLSSVQRGLMAESRTSPLPKEEIVDNNPTPTPPLDRLAAETVYASIEDKLRGSSEEIRNRQSGYIKLLENVPSGKSVVDLGCGRGEFLELLSESGIDSLGVDSSAVAVAECQEKGFEAKKMDLLDYLSSCEDESLRAVVSFQVLEHLSFPSLIQVLAESFRALMPGGIFLGETPNGANLAVGGSTFWLDHTHVRPLHPELLKHLAEFYGFTDVRVDLVSQPEVPWKLEPDEDKGNSSYAEAIIGLQEYVLSGQDALLVAYRPN